MNPEWYRDLLRRLGVEAEWAATDAYRLLLRQGFELMSSEADPNPSTRARFLSEQARLIDEIGPAAAREILRVTAHDFWRETGVCPWCGETGDYHESAR